MQGLARAPVPVRARGLELEPAPVLEQAPALVPGRVLEQVQAPEQVRGPARERALVQDQAPSETCCRTPPPRAAPPRTRREKYRFGTLSLTSSPWTLPDWQNLHLPPVPAVAAAPLRVTRKLA